MRKAPNISLWLTHVHMYLYIDMHMQEHTQMHTAEEIHRKLKVCGICEKGPTNVF